MVQAARTVAVRPFIVMVVMALIQVSVFDGVKAFGIAHLDLVLWAVVAAALTQPPAGAVKLGFAAGLALDILGPSYLGRQALMYLLVAWLLSTLAPRMLTAGLKAGWIERTAVIALCTLFIWALGATTGLAFPATDKWFVPGLLVSAAIGGVFAGPLRGFGRLFGEQRSLARLSVPKLGSSPQLQLELEAEPT